MFVFVTFTGINKIMGEVKNHGNVYENVGWNI